MRIHFFTAPSYPKPSILFARILSETLAEELDGSLEVAAVQDIGEAGFIDTLAFGRVETIAGSDHDGFPIVREILQHPDGKFLRIIDRKLHHDVDSPLRVRGKDARAGCQSGSDGITAVLIFFIDRFEVRLRCIIESSCADLLHFRYTEACLTKLIDLAGEFIILGDEAADTRSAGTVTLRYRVDDDDIVSEVFVGAKAGIRTVVDELAVYFIRN